MKKAHQILKATGLPVNLHAYGTNVEGEYDVVFAALKQIHETLHASEVPRISMAIRLGSRTDKVQGLSDKVAAIEAESQ